MEKKYKHGITFGAYDPLHFGHIEIFRRAKEQCEMLTVVVSDDEYIRKIKGHEERVSLERRVTAVASVRYVDRIGIQALIGTTKLDYIKTGLYDVIFVGDDHLYDFTGEGLGVPVVYLPHTPNISSTKLTQ
jgi:glycerol-3-phosphate cytidylyltransferase